MWSLWIFGTFNVIHLQETNVPKAVSLVNTHCIYEPSEEIDVKLMVKEAEKLSYIAIAIETGNMPAFGGIEDSLTNSSDVVRFQVFHLLGFKSFILVKTV